MAYQTSEIHMTQCCLPQLIPESLFLAIWILDAFLSKQEVERKNLQLVCAVSVLCHLVLLPPAKQLCHGDHCCP
jgi:Cyclin, N-terminal domain